MTGTGAGRFQYDGSQLAAVFDGSGNLLGRYFAGPNPDEWALWENYPNDVYPLQDWQGSVVALTDASGNATAINAYDEYGQPKPGNAGRMQYTGQMMLPDFGLQHYKARAYHVGLGRFVQTDPVGYEQGMNLYAYVGNDPVNAVDPTGLCKVEGDSLVDCTVTESGRTQAGNDRASQAQARREQRQADRARRQLIRVGRAIERNGTDEEKQAWADLKSVDLNFGTHPTRPNRSASRSVTPGAPGQPYSVGAMTIYAPGLSLPQAYELNVTLVHEIFHGTLANRGMDLRNVGAIERSVEAQARNFSWSYGLVPTDARLSNGYLGCTTYRGGRC